MIADEKRALLAIRDGQLALLNREMIIATSQLRGHNNKADQHPESVDACQPLQKSFDDFQIELLRFDGRSPVHESLLQIREVYPIISGLIEWQTHRRQNVSREEIETTIGKTIRSLTIRDYVPQLVALLKWDECVQRQWDSLLLDLSGKAHCGEIAILPADVVDHSKPSGRFGIANPSTTGRASQNPGTGPSGTQCRRPIRF